MKESITSVCGDQTGKSPMSDELMGKRPKGHNYYLTTDFSPYANRSTDNTTASIDGLMSAIHEQTKAMSELTKATSLYTESVQMLIQAMAEGERSGENPTNQTLD